MLWGITNRDDLGKETGQIDRDVIGNTGLLKVRLHIFCFNHGYLFHLTMCRTLELNVRSYKYCIKHHAEGG